MHFSVFEQKNFIHNERIFFTDLGGRGYNGLYKSNYNRGTAEFDFLNFDGSIIERVSLNNIQVIDRPI